MTKLLPLLLSLVLFTVGCGDKKVSLEEREGLVYIKGSDTLYTGEELDFYENGQKKFEGNYKDGKMDGLFVGWHDNGKKGWEVNWKDDKRDGLVVEWHENGQKKGEATFKDDKPVEGSEKFWNSKGEPVDSKEEAFKK
jgi:antitoxin component YwqK of YwqJK toxin-antitoxin module